MAQVLTRRQVLVRLVATPYLLSQTSRVALAATAEEREYSGALKTLPGGCIVLSSDGARVLAYFCDGTDSHPATVSRWMRGDIVGGAVKVIAGGVTLVAQLQGRRASGTLTLADGTSLPFTAHSRWPDGAEWGVYRGEEDFNGVHYVGGWIAYPEKRAGALRSGRLVQPVAWLAPSPVGDPIPTTRVAVLDPFEDDVDDDFPHTGGGIINQRTGAVLPYVAPNLATMTAEVPGLGTFHLHRCLQTKCA